MEGIEELRKRIDAIDSQVTELLKMRLAEVKKIGEFKKSEGLPVLDEKREAEKLERLAEGCADKSEETYLKSIYREIFKASRNAEE